MPADVFGRSGGGESTRDMSEAAGAEPELPDESDEPDEPDHDHADESRGSPARPRLEVSGTQVVAGALASVSAAVVASLFGAAGTLIGAGVASVVTTVSSAVYGVWIRHTGAKLRQTQGVLPFRPTLPSIPRGRIERWRAWLSQRRSGVLAGVGLVFVATMAVVTLVEAVGQRPLSSIAGRDSSGATSIAAVVRGDSDGNDSDSDSDDDSDDQSPDSTSTTTPSDDSASSTASTSPDGESDVPSDSPDSSVSTSTSTPRAPTTTAAEPPASTDQPTPSSAG
jgi:hypothetical protein